MHRQGLGLEILHQAENRADEADRDAEIHQCRAAETPPNPSNFTPVRSGMWISASPAKTEGDARNAAAKTANEGHVLFFIDAMPWLVPPPSRDYQPFFAGCLSLIAAGRFSPHWGRQGPGACRTFTIAPRAPLRQVLVVAQDFHTMGLIAGNRSLPLEFARQARTQGVKKIVAVAFENETAPELAALVDEIVWLKVGQLNKMIAALKDRGVSQCVMLGQIAPKNLFDLRPDFRALALLMKLKEKNAHSIFGALADELKKEGVELIEPVRWLQPLMPQIGFALGPALSAEQKEDVALGLRIAKEVSRLEIGQTVVVKDGTVPGSRGI